MTGAGLAVEWQTAEASEAEARRERLEAGPAPAELAEAGRRVAWADAWAGWCELEAARLEAEGRAFEADLCRAHAAEYNAAALDASEARERLQREELEARARRQRALALSESYRGDGAPVAAALEGLEAERLELLAELRALRPGCYRHASRLALRRLRRAIRSGAPALAQRYAAEARRELARAEGR